METSLRPVPGADQMRVRVLPDGRMSREDAAKYIGRPAKSLACGTSRARGRHPFLSAAGGSISCAISTPSSAMEVRPLKRAQSLVLAVTAAMPKTDAERQLDWRARQRAAGAVTISLVVPERVGADLRLVAEVLRLDPGLELGLLRDRVTGRLRSARKAAQASARRRGVERS
jgi:hypothetical protein